MSNIIECQIKVYNNEDYHLQMEEYNEHMEECERLGMTPKMSRPKKNSKVKYMDSVLYPKQLKREGLTHYVINLEGKETISLCFHDGSSIVLKETENLKEQLNKLYD